MVELKFDDRGLIPVVVQDYYTRQVLILAFMNEESIKKTMETNLATFWSRSRNELWTKGETSGNFLEVVTIQYDCDEDALLMQVIPKGPACHTRHTSCFYRNFYDNDTIQKGNVTILKGIEKTIKNRIENPSEKSYTNYLLSEGIDKICKKVGEEATETVIAAKNGSKEEIAAEAGDLIYHLEVLLADCGMNLDDVYKVLEQRHGKVSEIKREGKKKRGQI